MTATNPTHRALVSLLPSSSTNTFTIPPRLLSAADSLLTLSRQRHPHLKPDEEIARAHVCAEIACKRLRAPLRLPNMKSGNGAPCRPAIYKKLLGFFEKVLGDIDLLGTPKRAEKKEGGGTTPRTGTGKKRNVPDVIALESGEDEVDEVQTPSKKRRVAGPPVTPTKTSGKKINGFAGKIQISASKKSKDSPEAPTYVLPAIRKLCKAFKTPKLVPHVYTGVCVILNLATADETDPTTQEPVDKQRTLSLVMAVYLMTVTRMQKGLMTTEVYNAVSERSIAILDLQEQTAEVQSEIENWITRVNDEEWTTLHGKGEDWWSSVPEDVIPALKLSTINSSSKVTASGEEVEIDGDEDDEDEATPRARNRNVWNISSRREELRKQLEEEDPEDVLLPGLGTMVNDAVDYFSEERNAEFEAWKADVFRRIDAIEKSGGGGSVRKGKGRAVMAAA